MKLKTLKTRMTWCATLALWVAPYSEASAQGPGYPDLTHEQELRLAYSAGPEHLAMDATVYVMSAAGFERAVEGKNGFTCLVVRSAAMKHQLAPHCLNPAGTESVLPAFLREGALQARGMEAEAIQAELRRQWESGELPIPESPASAYMLSEGQRLGPNGGNFRPHFMLYSPYAKNDDIGGDPREPTRPFVGPYENHPLSTIVIIMDEFVDPASVALPGGR